MTSLTADSTGVRVPFDREGLDRLLDEAGLEAVLATSPHNVRYLLGGYAYFMYAFADSIGLSRYLPAVAYRRAAPAHTLYVGAGNEDWATDVQPLWVPEVRNVSWGTQQTAELLVEWCHSRVPSTGRIGVELAYLPADAYRTLTANHLVLDDATELLESLRAVKRPDELGIVRRSSTAVVDAMLATFRATRAGESKAEVFERLRREETERGLTFCYALVAAGSGTNRAPSRQTVQLGDALSLDSGATCEGWVADLTRMAVIGEPTSRHEDLLAQVDHVQQAAIGRAVAGAHGREVFDAADAALAECDDGARMSFLAHGTGLVTHEAPRLTSTGSPPYAAAHADLPLQEGMVLSIESQVADPRLGFIKLEDTVIVHDGVSELVADHGRHWTWIDG